MKHIFSVSAVFVFAFALSGCSLSSSKDGIVSTGVSGSILKSSDAGEGFLPKVKVNEETSLPASDILTISFDPNNPAILYAGTESDGIFRSWDGGEHWERINFPPTRVFSVITDFRNSERLLATGIWKKTGKIYESGDSGKSWKEVYTEPGEGTSVASIAQSRIDPNAVYAGTSGGVILKSEDGGQTWRNFGVAKGPVTDIYPHPNNEKVLAAAVFNVGTIRTTDGGATYIESKSTDFPVDPRRSDQNASGGVLTLARDPSRSEVLYAGMQGGMYRTEDYGKTWQNIDIIESSRKYPIRAIAVNPTNSDEISYAAGDTFYRSTDGGKNWNTTRLQASKGVSVIAYDWKDPKVIYIGLRKFK